MGGDESVNHTSGEKGRSTACPEDLSAALRAAVLEDRFAALAGSHRRGYVRSVTEAKRAGTRANRVAKAVVMVGRGGRSS